jgi:hypothetical protein
MKFSPKTILFGTQRVCSFIGTDRSAINKQFEPFQYHFVDPLLDSSTASHVKNGMVLNKRLQPGSTMEQSDPNRTNKRMLLVPVQKFWTNKQTHPSVVMY